VAVDHLTLRAARQRPARRSKAIVGLPGRAGRGMRASTPGAPAAWRITSLWFSVVGMGELNRLADHLARPARGDAVVRPLSRAARRPCARPACPSPSSATLTFDYRRREAWIHQLADGTDPGSYDLCATHVARTRAPYGWRLRDRRPSDERVDDTPPIRPADFDSPRIVAVIAAALRAAPSSVPEHVETQRSTEVTRDDAGVAADGGGLPERRATAAAKRPGADGAEASGPPADGARHDARPHRVARSSTDVTGSVTDPTRVPAPTSGGPRSTHRAVPRAASFATDW
jgi:hypothetical protein